VETTIYLIRHGATAANLENRFAGRTAEELNQSGCQQIEEVGRRLADKGITSIIASPLKRTCQSAEILSNFLRIPMTTDEAFNEIAIPHWDGLDKEIIKARFGQEYPEWQKKPPSFQAPGCETLVAVSERAVAGLERLILNHPGETILVVSHLIALRCLALHYQNQDLAQFRSIKIANASICHLVRNDSTQTVFTFL
jgi:broad specificity phosphatase PhoE